MPSKPDRVRAKVQDLLKRGVYRHPSELNLRNITPRPRGPRRCWTMKFCF
jgi:hypothetical protein